MPNPLFHHTQVNGDVDDLTSLPSGPPAGRRAGTALLPLLAGLIGAGVVAAILFATGVAGSKTTVTTVQTAVPASNDSNANQTLNASGIYQAAAPGVVDITASGVTGSSNGFPFSPPHQSTQVATGTGFEVDSQGDIVTAQHVVAGANKVTVKLQDGTVRTATVLGTDDSTDVAVLHINPSGLTLHPLPLGDSAALSVGNPLVVIGDPFNYNRSLSTGVVSALDRTIQAPDGFTIADAIQTDAAINPGNSGGPLLNANGEVIGIADQIATGNTGADSFTGVGFAVPINGVKSELSQLENGAHVKHAYLGVAIGQTTGNQSGAQISSVQAGGPAGRAGLKAGDVVTAVDGKTITGQNGLVSAIAAHKPGQKMTLNVQRGSSRLTLTVTLGTQPNQA
jgi:putative serine protease PepD